MTPPEVQAAVGPVLEEVGVQIDLLDQGARAYVFAVLANDAGVAPRPKPPAGMHPGIAAALRDMARDEATAIQLFGARPERRRNSYQARCA